MALLQALVTESTALGVQERNYLGIRYEVTDPFNLYVSVDDLMDASQDKVNFFAYSVGRKRIIVWGSYEKAEAAIVFDGGCRFELKQLQNMVRGWSEGGYEYGASAMVDRVQDTILGFLGMRRFPSIANHQEYVDLKAVLAHMDGQLTFQQINEQYPGALARFYSKCAAKYGLGKEEAEIACYLALDDYVALVRDEVVGYEQSINLSNIPEHAEQLFESIAKGLAKSLKVVADAFMRAIETSAYVQESAVRFLPACKTMEECAQLSAEEEGCAPYHFGMRPSLR